MIQIQQSEIEALIQDRLTAGGFDNVEQVLLQALRDAPLPNEAAPTTSAATTGAEIIAAFQRCPVEDFDFNFEQTYAPVNEPVRF